MIRKVSAPVLALIVFGFVVITYRALPDGEQQTPSTSTTATARPTPATASTPAKADKLAS